MFKVLYVLIIFLSIWLGMLPWVYGYDDWMSIGVPMACSLATVGLSILGTRQPSSKYPAILIAILGFVLFAWAALIGRFVGALDGYAVAIIGLIWLLLGLVITQLFVFPSGSAHDKSGNTLTTISSIRVKGNDIVVKAVLLGTMPSTIYMHPEEVWKVLPLIDAGVIWQLPRILYRGWKGARQLVKKANKPR